MTLYPPATTSTDLFDGPQYRTCGGMLFPPSADFPATPWFHLANKYANRTPVTLFPVPIEKIITLSLKILNLKIWLTQISQVSRFRQETPNFDIIFPAP